MAAPAPQTADAGVAAAAAAASPAPAAASAADESGLSEFPQYDPTTIGLPSDFLLYKYNALKG